MSLAPGTRLDHYELVGPLGSGGMGEVWRARDTSLDREVAIKVLPPAFADDPERLARFEREAKVLASLNHPNIAGIFGLHGQGGVRFLAMELVPGEDLAERLKQGPLPVAEALDVARQIAEALEAAHEQGIVHRDLKPANVKLTPDGKVKVLDFGLAKALETATSSAPGRDAAMSPTITSLGTIAGVILGTAAYMSPEQARGKPVDKRADIWAFGCVLYEMLTGRRPFDGETVSDTLAAVLAKDADWSALPAATPPKVRDLIQRCLDKDAKHRVRDIGDARIELEEALAARTASGRFRAVEERPAPAAKAAPRWIPAAMLLAGALVGALGFWLVEGRTPPPVSGGVVRLDLDLPADIRATQFRVNPDGSGIVVFGAPRVPAGQVPPPSRLYLRRFATGTMAAIPGTEGCTANGLLISANGREVAFGLPATAGSQQFNIVRVPLDGSAPPFTIVQANPRWTTGGYLNDGDFVTIEDGTGLVRIPASGGGPSPPVKIDLAGEPGRIRIADLALPGDGAILLHTVAYSEKGWYYRTGVLDLKTARISYLLDDGGYPAYVAATKQIVFSRGDALLAVGFDPKTLKLTGTPVPIAGGLRTEYAFQPADFRMSNDGVLVYAPGGRTAEGRRLGVVDAAGNVTPLSDEGHAFQRVSASSADGRRIVATITNGQGIDELWTGEIDRPGLRRIAAVSGADLITPLSTRDGRTAVFGQIGHGPDDGIYVKTIDDTTAPRRIASLPEDIRTVVTSVTPDGSGVVVVRDTRDRKSDVFYLPIPAAGGALSEFTPILSGPGNEGGAHLSPDGRWIAYTSDDSGRPEIYVAPFHGAAPLGDARRVTTSGGIEPYWGADGRSLRFQDPGGRIMSVTVTTAPTLTTGPPVVVYDSRKLNVFQAEILPDGKQLVLMRGEDETDEIQRLTVVLGFPQELAEKTKTAR